MPKRDSPIPPIRLSTEAFQELKNIIEDEFGNPASDEEIDEIGSRLLRLFALLDSRDSKLPNPERKRPTVDQFKALKYVHSCVHHDKKVPTVRGVAQAIGFRSSRSGLRMMKALLEQGFIFRDGQGAIGMREDLAGCDTSFTTLRDGDDS